MRCPHCSSAVADSDWFCPDCKRGLAKQWRRRRITAVVTGLLAAVVLGALVLLVRALPAVSRTVASIPQMEISAAAVRQEAGRFSSGGPASGHGAVSVVTVPPVRTFVYLNGGRLLGETPLRNASIPSGRHTLVLWAPSIRGRCTRTVDVDAGQSTLVIENIREQERFKDGAGS